MPLHQKLGLSVRLSQRLILTPSLQQAIKLLPLTTLELAEVLEQEVMENPLLEEEPVEETKTVEEIAQEETAERERPDDPLKEIDVERFFEDYFDNGADRRTRPSEVPEVAPIENTLTESPDLYDHLLWQLRMTEADEATLEIGEAIIQNLDEDGLLRVSLEDVAAMGPWPMEAVEATLALVQALDPPGVAAREPHREPPHPAPRARARELAGGRHGARPHEAAPEPPVPGDLAAHGSLRRRGGAPPRDHPGALPAPRAPATARSAPTTSCPTCSW